MKQAYNIGSRTRNRCFLIDPLFNSPGSLFYLIFLLVFSPIQAQKIELLPITDGGLEACQIDGQTVPLLEDLPLVTFQINQTTYTSNAALPTGLRLSFSSDSLVKSALHRAVLFKNVSSDTIILENVVPLGTNNKAVYITGKGSHRLSRSHLFLPARVPLNVILPDNAWELGYSGTKISDSLSVAALARRDLSQLKNGQRRRFETVLYPGGEVAYNCYFIAHKGAWQVGLRKVFQTYKLFDVLEFDAHLFEREDLKWIQNDYVMHLFMAWDQAILDETQQLNLDAFLEQGKQWYGGDDGIGIWPTWPTLGLDQRNQFDLFRDLPGGLPRLRAISQELEQSGAGLFICYNPWDESTRGEDHLDGLYQIVKATQAKGVVLDTRGASSYALQAAADSARSGVVMYSEGMAVPRDMQGIVAGRVHNALYYPPLLNLNRLIQPDFSIFRVAEIAKERVRREIGLSYFNGHGIEFNVFAPGKPSWLGEQYRFLGETVRVLRDHSTYFSHPDYLPLLPTLEDQIYVNAWPEKEATVYTIFSLQPTGFQGPLFAVRPKQNTHYFDLFHYQEVETDTLDGHTFIQVDLPGFDAKYLGTNNEGAVGGIAAYPQYLSLSLNSDDLNIQTDRGDTILVWAGKPAYDKQPLRLPARDTSLYLQPYFGPFEGLFVVQLFEEGVVIDQRSLKIKAGTPRLISRMVRTKAISSREGMVPIPAGRFQFKSTHGDAFIRYPDYNEGRWYEMKAFLMDKHPVTNEQYKQFLEATSYTPRNPRHFLKHWPDGKMPDSLARHPVVYVSYEDAQAYAKWAGKRLPTEVEWQYAAQAGDERSWPWSKVTRHIYREEEPVTNTLTVYKIKGIGEEYCNLGNGKSDEVGTYPSGANPYGLEDLVGSVWQLTDDLYRSGSYTYIMMKGGSYFNPSASWWYVQGGPRELHYRQYLLRVSEGFERNATVGFRCVQDIFAR